jgi:hypothetical protein
LYSVLGLFLPGSSYTVLQREAHGHWPCSARSHQSQVGHSTVRASSARRTSARSCRAVGLCLARKQSQSSPPLRASPRGPHSLTLAACRGRVRHGCLRHRLLDAPVPSRHHHRLRLAPFSALRTLAGAHVARSHRGPRSGCRHATRTRPSRYALPRHR